MVIVFYVGDIPSLSLCLLSLNTRPKFVGPGRIINPEWIDINVVRKWNSRCLSRHAENCQATAFIKALPPTRPALLIETWLMCLTEGSEGDRYVSLSYVWGRSATLKTLNANLELLKRCGSLNNSGNTLQDPENYEECNCSKRSSPRTIYLVDSLCIFQDDHDVAHDQINKMAPIYANATFTIIAANGHDPGHGLRGFRDISLPRKTHQKIFKAWNGSLISECLGLNVSNANAVWHKRGWTFQENLFSARKLYFSSDRV